MITLTLQQFSWITEDLEFRESTKETLKLVYVHGLSVAEVAKEKDISRQAIYKLTRQIEEALPRKLDREGKVAVTVFVDQDRVDTVRKHEKLKA